MPNEPNEKGKMYRMYGNYVQVPYTWYGLCRKYIIPKEVKIFKDKKENCIELNPMEINVLAYLANYDECYVTNSSIAEVFNVKKQTIEKYMKELRWVGFIKTFESKDSPTHTDRRDIYVQHDIIKMVLKSESNPYIVSYEYKVHDECKVSDKCEVHDEHHASTLQTDGNYPTNVMQVPDECNTNKNKLEYIKINKNKDGAKAPTEESKLSSNASDEANQSKTEDRYSVFHQSFPMDLNIYKDITEKDVETLQFNSATHSDMYDDYEYIERIYEKYVECCNNKRNANDTISCIKSFMKQFNCDEKAIETCVGYFLYQHRKEQKNIQDLKLSLDEKIAS